MPKPSLNAARTAAAALIAASMFNVSPALSGGVTGQATEWTQLLNNGELVTMVGKSTEQINNQVTQISQLA